MKLRFPKDWIKKFKGQKGDFIPPMGALYEDKEKIKMIEIEADNKSPKKRLSYEMIYDERKTEIDNLSLDELSQYRQNIIDWKNQVEDLMKEKGAKDSRRQYLIGLRNHVINPVLNYIKKRKAILNRVIHNGVSRDFACRFVEQAMKKLPLKQFQEIYGAALSKVDIENQTIKDIKKFMKESQNDQIQNK